MGINDMVTAIALQTPVTTEEFLGMYPEETNQPIELIEGEVIVSPSPLSIHQQISLRLSVLIGKHVLDHHSGEVLVAPSDLHLDEKNVPQPDLFFVSKDNTHCKVGERGWWEGAPDLCIEIVSPTSIRRDRVTQFNLYQKHGVREYWIVDPDGRFIEVYVLTEDRYQRAGGYVEGDTFTSSVLPDLSIPVDEVFPTNQT
jgi:Uma2 family endonuclease